MNLYSLWINWSKRVVSFQEAEGFVQLHYPTHEAMLRFAVAKGLDGFGIQ